MTIPASLATACAAHDRHRLDVLDLLLDEAAPSAVRELLGAALDLCATLRARRDELTAQLAEARAELSKAQSTDGMLRDDAKQCSVYADKLRADLASERAHLAACKQRIVAMEAAANKHRAEIDAAVGQLAAARQVIDENRAHAEGFARDLAIAIRERDEERATVARLIKAVDPKADSTDDALRVLAERTTAMITADREVARLTSRLEHASREWTAASDDASTAIVERDRLTARVAELEARPVLTVERLTSAVYLSRGIPTDIAAEAAKRILAALGPVTLPAQDRAEELAAARWAAWRDEAGDTPTTPWDDLRDHRRDSEVRIMKRALRVVGAPPTSQPAARPVFAGVDPWELFIASNEATAGFLRQAGIDRLSTITIGEWSKVGVDAVLARLEVSLVAPVDPEAVARAYHDHKDAPAPEWDEVDAWRGRDSDEQSCAIAAMRAVLAKHGIPVTPEVSK